MTFDGAEPRMQTVAVVGTSLAGLRAIETLRREGYDGRIVAIGAEPHLPYDRPPLSKEFLAGTADADDIVLRKQGVDDLDVDWRLGVAAVALDVALGRSSCADGARVAFDGLVIATGSTPRRLPNQPDLRRRAHAAHARRRAPRSAQQLDARPKVVVIGAGFIGAEVAATCRGARARRDGARSAAAADGARPRAGARRGDRRPAPRPRRRPAHRRAGRRDRRRRERVERVRLGDGSVDRQPTWWSSASAWCPRPRGSKAPGSRSTTAWCATRRVSPRPASSRPATSPAGRTRCSTGR